MKPVLLALCLGSAGAVLTGCGEDAASGPPAVRLGDSVCDQCNMIISDQRWATTTMVDGPRGAEPRLFDDFNCQVNYEVEHSELTILARWSHCHSTNGWVPTEQASFLVSSGLRTPMGSGIAAFSSEAEARAAAADMTGEVMAFEGAWGTLGFVGACCQAGGASGDEASAETPGSP